MKSRIRLFAAAALGGLAIATAAPALAHDHKVRTAGHARTAPTLVDVASSNPEVSTLVSAVSAAGLVGTLSGAGPFTVFAPTNAAFDDLPEGAVASLLRPSRRSDLSRILTYHVVSGRITAADLATAIRVGGGSATVTTVEGGVLRVSRRQGGLRLTDEAGAHIDIVTADVTAANGVIHVIDGVLTPH